MAYDEGLAERIREQFSYRGDVEEKKMFGGLCFMISSHMCCGIVGDMLMARVGPQRYEALLGNLYAKEMDFTGKPMKGMIYVGPEGLSEDIDLILWLKACTDFSKRCHPKKGHKLKNFECPCS